MSWWMLLAQAQGQGAEGTQDTIPEGFVGRVPIDDIWNFIAGVSWLQAVVFVAFGAVFIIYGWRIYKALVVINIGALGLAGGMFLGGRLGRGCGVD